MTDLLFGQAYHLRFDPKLWNAMEPYPPLGTLYAAALLRERGWRVALHDSMLAEGEEAWAAALDRHRPRFAALYEDNFNYLTKMCLQRMREAALRMIDMARDRDCAVIVAGSDATDNAEIYLDRGARVVLLGDGEEALTAVMSRLGRHDSADLRAVANIAFRERAGTGEVRSTERRPVKPDLDVLPTPAWDLVDMDRYRRTWMERHGRFSLNMVTTRGCPYHCNWCAKPLWGQRYHVRRPERVAAELTMLAERYRPDHIWYMDDIMGLEPGWLNRYADVLERAGLRIPFKCLTRPDLVLREDTVDALRRAGCEIVWIGAESGSQRVLDAMEKGTTVEQIREAARRLHAAGIRVAFFLQFGYPGETRTDVEATLQMVRDCRPDDIGVAVSYPLPGTPFYERVRDELGDKRHWDDSDDLAMMYRGPFTTDFYRQLHRLVHTEFRARRVGRQLLQLGRTPWRLRGRHLVRAGGVLYRWARLPVERIRLNRLARRPHRGIGPLPPGMTAEEAAVPSPPTD
jgi:anaerobic magnesium-protoporphyrin IX monomethyl ester cyclase